MKKSPFAFTKETVPQSVDEEQWFDWKWQFRESLKTREDFSSLLDLTPSEIQGFSGLDQVFRVRSTPYYASLIDSNNPSDPIRQMVLPQAQEMKDQYQAELDPLGEQQQKNRVASRLVHRYSDRVLFLMTDMCSVYCRYCTRKHFTAQDQVLASSKELQDAVNYVRLHPGIREVIFSGGDPLSCSVGALERCLKAFYEIPHVELIRIGTRIPVVCPMRITKSLLGVFQAYKPVYLMTHFNHPQELTQSAANALESLVDHGVPVFNQMVLLNGINNHPAIVQALSRRLLYLRVKPYYMFQADPSQGTDHLRNSIEDSLEIQKSMWGHVSGLMMPNYIVDIPQGGGKAAMTPQFEIERTKNIRSFKGWDGIKANYISPETIRKPSLGAYEEEWLRLKEAKSINP